MITNNNPNIYWQKCTYAVTLMMLDYSKTIEVEVGGNVRGFDLIETAVEALFDDLEFDDDGMARIELTNPAGETLQCKDDELEEVDWLKELVVAVVQIKQEKDKL